jgi:short-subunit dehydrogenase
LRIDPDISGRICSSFFNPQSIPIHRENPQSLLPTMRQRLKDKVTIITGASSGIGKATALLFAREGASVVLAARSEERLRQVQREIASFNGEAVVVPTDVTKKEAVDNLVRTAVAEFGRIDIVVNNAGIGLWGRVAETPFSIMEEVLNVNLYGALYCIHAVLSTMLKQGSGQIINISSVLGKRATPNVAAYCATKYALHGFSDSLRAELADSPSANIDVIVVCPSTTATEFFRNMRGRQQGKSLNPFGSMSAEAVAKKILHASLRRKHEVVISFGGKLLVWSNRLFPRLIDKLMVRVARRQKRNEIKV